MTIALGIAAWAVIAALVALAVGAWIRRGLRDEHFGNGRR